MLNNILAWMISFNLDVTTWSTFLDHFFPLYTAVQMNLKISK